VIRSGVALARSRYRARCTLGRSRRAHRLLARRQSLPYYEFAAVFALLRCDFCLLGKFLPTIPWI
jgi:hypothetical protein